MFSIKESLKYGWEKFKVEKGLWAATLAMMVLMFLTGGTDGRHGGYAIVSFLAFIAMLIARVGYTKLTLKINDGEHFEWPVALEQTFKTHGVFWKFFWTSVLSGLVVGVGFILLIIPGLFLLPTYFFATFIAVDLGLGPVASMKESALITKGKRLKILGFILVLAILNIIGGIAFGLGLFISIPVSALATVQVYRKLSAEKLAIQAA